MKLKALPINTSAEAVDYKSLYYGLFKLVGNACNALGITLHQAEELYLYQTDSIDIIEPDNFKNIYYAKSPAVGVHRNIDSVGRVVIPMEMRRFLDINDGTSLEITMEGKRIWLQKHMLCCVVCDCEDNLHQHSGRYLCQVCTGKLL